MTPETDAPTGPDTENPLVTLFVMAYRQEGFVAKAVAGALAQTHEPLEIILSDDASPDGTYAIMQEMAAAYTGPHRVILNRNPVNLGLIGHVNRIMELASGGLVIQNAGDDVSRPDRAARLAEVWRAGGGRIAALHSAAHDVSWEGERLGILAPGPDAIAADPAPDPVNVALPRAIGVGASLAWTPALFARFGPLAADLGGWEDKPVFFRAAALGEIAYVPEPLVARRRGGLTARHGGSNGWNYLFGDRVRRMDVAAGHARSHLHDLAQLAARGEAPPWAGAVAATCRATLRDFAFQVDLARAPALARIAALPGALWQSLRQRNSLFAVQTAKYALGPLYVRWCDLRRMPPRNYHAR